VCLLEIPVAIRRILLLIPSFCRATAVLAAAKVPEQIHIAYTGIKGELSVDFVSDAAVGAARWTVDNSSWTLSNSTSFNFVEIGWMHQALMQFGTLKTGAPAWYQVGSQQGGWSPAFKVFPRPARGEQEVFAVFGDFGLSNDISMNALIADAAAGAFDTVLHVGGERRAEYRAR
jgi:hypothetical protein